jgi:hypothetical protein
MGEDDHEAKRLAEQLVDGHAVELQKNVRWSLGSRQVTDGVGP